MGKLYPINTVEVLPGDSFLGNSSCLIRTVPLVATVMRPVHVRMHHFFTPTRILFDEWESFITGGNDGLGDGAVLPTITSPAITGWTEGSLPDYLGIPTGVPDLEVSALPIYAFNKTFNEYYRDQDMVAERALDDVTIPNIAWEKCYLTASRPWPQRGPDVTLPLGTTAPIRASGVPGTDAIGAYSTDAAANRAFRADASDLTFDTNLPAGTGLLEADLSGATASSVNTIREAFAKQRYQEARAMYGARYTEYLRYLGIVPSDARLQRPEYLSGGKQTISFSEVLQTSESSTDPLGTLGGHGIAAVGTKKYMRYFTEHGYVQSFLSIRPKSIYANGLQRHWNRRTKEDYFQKELQHIGQQEVLNKEVYAAGSGDALDDEVFSYQDRYSEYKKQPSMVTAGMRGSVYDDWNMARIFASRPSFNSSFTDCDPAGRIFSTTAVDTLQVMCQNTIRARRMISKDAQNRIY